MIIRHITPADAPAFLQLINKVEKESEYMLMEPGERDSNIEEEKEKIKKITSMPNSTIMVAELDGKLKGYIIAIGGQAIRNKHSVYLAAGVDQGYRGQGMGTKLFKAIEKWAVSKKVHGLN
ncbi:N-acetyltransferase family protein [Halobacillus sp. Marseille-Q1614]|uniref:GNAT family N-acetyltransferase n=1 Tax=Halobacillus sp. Marseille-Q1614 TaxID=2709134 RepID=UPI0035303EB7